MAKQSMIKIRSKKQPKVADQVDAPAAEPAAEPAVVGQPQQELTVHETTEPDTTGQVAPPAPKKAAAPTVTVTVPCKGQSPKFLEIEIDAKQAWLAKESLVSFEVEDGMAVIEMSRTLARRRGLIEKLAA